MVSRTEQPMASLEKALFISRPVSIAGIGDFRGSEHLEPGLTTVRMPAKRIGLAAADTLLHMSETGMVPDPSNQSIPVELKVRNSTGRRQP